MIDDFDKDEIKNKKPLISSYKNNTNYNLFYNCSKSKSKDLNFLNTKENDMNKYNIFAKSKLMDINDIKKFIIISILIFIIKSIISNSF